MARIASDWHGSLWTPLGYEIHRAAILRLKAFDAVHEENLAWVDDYYETYARSLNSSKDLVPKTPRRGRKRKVADEPAAETRSKRLTRASERHNSKNVPQHVDISSSSSTRIAEPSLGLAHADWESRGLRNQTVPASSAAPVAVTKLQAAAATRQSPAVGSALTSPQPSTLPPLVRIVGFEQMTVKSKALAYEALVNGKGGRSATPGKTCADVDRANKVPTHATGTPTQKTVPRVCISVDSDESHGLTGSAKDVAAALPPRACQAKAKPSGANSPRPAAAASPVSSSNGKPKARLSVSLRFRRLSAQKARSSAAQRHSSTAAQHRRSTAAQRLGSGGSTKAMAAALVPGSRDSTDSGYPESVLGGPNKSGKGSSVLEPADVTAHPVVAPANTQKRKTRTASGGGTAAICVVQAPAAVDGSSDTQAAELIAAAEACAVQHESATRASSRVTSLVDSRGSRGSRSHASHTGDGEVSAPLVMEVGELAASCTVESAIESVPVNPKARTKVISRKEPPCTGDSGLSQGAEGACLRVTRSKMRLAKTVDVPVTCEPSTAPPRPRVLMERESDSHDDDADDDDCASSPAKLMRVAPASMQAASAVRAVAPPSFTSALAGSAMKKATTDSCLVNKKYCTPDNVRTVGLSMTNSGQKSFLSSTKSSSSLLNRSITSPGPSRMTALVSSFVKRTVTPGAGMVAMEKQKLKEKKLQEKELASTENKRKREDLLHERLDTHKRQREEKLKRAAELREQQERDKADRQRLLEQKQAEKTEALNRAKESKIREEKEKAKLRDQKLQEAEERRKEQLRLLKQKEEEEAARAKRAREQEEQEKATAKREREQKERERAAAVKVRAATEAECADRTRAELGAATTSSVKNLVGTLSEKERLHEERKVQILAEERRLLAAAATGAAGAFKPGSVLTTIAENGGAATSSNSALRDNTNVSSVPTAAPAEKTAHNPRATMTKASSTTESYAMTPPPPSSRRHATADPDNYDITDLNSGDETDDDSRPRKVVPLWAQGTQLKYALVSQHYHPPDLDALFPVSLRQPCDLAAVFKKHKPRYYKRTSSATWSSPLMDPTLSK